MFSDPEVTVPKEVMDKIMSAKPISQEAKDKLKSTWDEANASTSSSQNLIVFEHPFTEQESKVMDLIVEANNLFITTGPFDRYDLSNWINGIHLLQNLLTARACRRQYPTYFKQP